MIYIIEDDENIRNLVQVALNGSGYETAAFETAEEALGAFKVKAPQLAIFDLMLPGMDGLEAIRKIRANDAWKKLPVLVLTAKDKEYDKVAGLDGGADDSLTKPFSVLQLRARVEAHLRRERRVPSYRFVSGGLRFDLQAKKVYAGEQELSLTRSEYMLCETLARHPGLVYTREQLLEEVFGFDSDSGEAAVTEHIKNLRGKLASCGSAPIETVWGMGYRWNSEKA